MRNASPPKLALRFLRWFCPPSLYESIEGDLFEQFEEDMKLIGEKKARRRFVWNVLKFFKPGILLRNRFSFELNQLDMLYHYFKILFRTTLKNKSYAFINISGLAIGMTAFALISLYVGHERSYDNFHAAKDRIFRVRHDRYNNGELNRQWVGGPMGIGSDLKDNFPEVNRFVRVNKGTQQHNSLANAEIIFEENRLLYASEDFFKIFSFPLLKGVDSLVLSKPFTMVVSESLAKRYFGETDPIGRTLKCNRKEEYEITGIFKDIPENSHLKFDALFSFESLFKILGQEETKSLMTNWGWEGTFTYIELNPSVNAKEFQDKIPAFVEKRMGAQLREWNEWMAFTLQPISSIHLNSNAPDELEVNGNGQTTNFLALIAILILVMAWINYINLATARSMERAKEVGIRKVLGGIRSQLIRQFLLESFVFKLTALLITVLLVGLLLHYFSLLIGRTINWHILNDVTSWIFIVTLFGIGMICTSLYPALVISAFKPASILKGKFQSSSKGIFVRKSLVTIQFVSSVVLIASSFVVYKQIHFMRNSELGVDIEQVLVMKGPSATDSKYFNRFKTLCQSLLQYPEIKKVTVSTDVPGHPVRWANGNVRLVGQDVNIGHSYQAIMTDENFIDAFGLSLIKGRNFSGDLKDQWKSVIVNETAMKLLGFTEPEKLIGRKIYLWDDEPEIIGVIKDYHQESLKQIVKPLILVYDQRVSDFYSIKIKTNRPIKNIIHLAEGKYKEAFPGNPFSYYFLDDHYDNQYKADNQFGKVSTLFTAIGIIIACLGLFGLSSYSVLQRTKEIGIRKVLGASVKQITLLVSKEFILIVLLANFIAWPIAYLLMDNWLNGFANRINLGVLSFLIPGAITLLIAILTVASQSIKAAMTDPVNSLKSE